MTRLAALDLGSNSFHLLVADRRPRGRIKRVTTRKIALRLGDPVTRTGALGETAYARAMAALRELVADAADHGAEQVVAVATEALRVAADGAAFRAEVLRDLRIPIQLLTGLDEAALSLRGTTAALTLPAEEPVLGLDLGGGSFEIAYGTPDGLVDGASLPLGGAKLVDRMGDPPRLVERARLWAHAMALVQPVADAIAARRADRGEAGPLRAVGTAGTIRDLARLALSLAGGSPPQKVRGLLVHRDQLEAAYARLCSVDVDERMDLPGVSAKRADLLPAAGTSVLAVMEAFGLEHLQLCDWGLREGVLLDVVGGCDLVDPAHVVPLDRRDRQ